MRHRDVGVLGAVSVIALVSGGWLLQRGAPEQEIVYHRARLLDDIVASVAAYYVDSINASDLYDMAVDGMLQNIGDPYTGFIRDEDFGDLTLSATGNYSGIGLRVESSDGWITVVTPFADGPAEKAGVLAGDRIVEVEGEGTYRWSVDRAVSELRGETGEEVSFRVARAGIGEPIEFTVARGSIHVSSVRYSGMLDDQIGYIWLESITEESSAELTSQVQSLRELGARSLIFDLRWNPGGVLGQAIEISDLFLDPGDVVVETKGRVSRANRSFGADEEERWADMPVIVLINGFSASASEIIAGALQDHDRALLIGTPTFGKGLVQTVFSFGSVEALKVTTGRWYTPVGRSIHRLRGELEIDADSILAVADGETFRTMNGRPLQGGGGIHPDIVFDLEPSKAELAFNQALGSDVQVFRDVVASYARELIDAGRVGEGFEPTAEMRRELHRRLLARGSAMSFNVWDGGSEIVDRQLAYQALRYGLGLDVEMQRRTADDPLVREAVDILSRVDGTEALLEVAANN